MSETKDQVPLPPPPPPPVAEGNRRAGMKGGTVKMTVTRKDGKKE